MPHQYCNIDIVIKTVKGFENTVASYINEIDENVIVEPKPKGFLGIVLVRNCKDKYGLAEKIKSQIMEAEKVLVAEACVKADPKVIAEKAAQIAKEKISPNETFAVRTVRRGSHNYTSVDVNVIVGDYVRKATNALVDLTHPDKIVAVEIFQDEATISVYPGTEEYKKMKPGKKPVLDILGKMSIIQMPYLGPLDATRTMGVRIGREIQTFEVKELVISPIGLVDAYQLKVFLDGVFEGIESRYKIQVKSYGRKTRKVPVFVQDLYQLVRSRFNEPIIVFEPEGDYIVSKGSELKSIFFDRKVKRVNMLIGSREGIPSGIYRFADLVLDICPGVTISTDYAAASAIMAVLTVLGGGV
ncbi:MAG TPA: RNA-binding protein [Desulfurococcales archaeon]|nr:RNA-binding protein [Desulfurococcales archaeon]